MSPVRTLTAAVVLAGSLAGCAAGLHDQTSQERSTPYVAGAAVGPLKVRGVLVTAAPGASPAAGGDTGTTQGYLNLVLVNNGSTPDTITGLQVGGAGVTPTDASTTGTVEPGRSLIFGGAGADGTTTNQLAISGLSQPLVPGTTIAVNISFQNAGQVTIQAPVVAAG